MKSAATGTTSGCIVWVLVFGAITMCLVPLGFGVGSFTATSALAIRTVSPFICPKGTTRQIYSYENTSTDENAFPVPATDYELHCADPGGAVIKNDVIEFGFLWDGISVLAALIVTGGLAFLLAAPACVLIGRLFGPRQKSSA